MRWDYRHVVYMCSLFSSLARVTAATALSSPGSMVPEEEDHLQLQPSSAWGRSSAAIALMVTMMDACRWNRVFHILDTTAALHPSATSFDVVVLHDAQTMVQASRHHDRLFVAPQPPPPKAWASFSQRLDGSMTSSGVSKGAFLRWLLASPYEFAWHLEDDVVYTGDWGRLLSLLSPSFKDLVNCQTEVHVSSNVGWLQKFPVRTCMTGEHMPCSLDHRLGGVIAKTRWPLLGISKRLAREITRSLEASGGARGHHEALTSTVCKLNDWCLSDSFPSALIGRYGLRGFGRFQRRYFESQTRALDENGILESWSSLGVQGILQKNRLYHPVKCPVATHASESVPPPQNPRVLFDFVHLSSRGHGDGDGTEPCNGRRMDSFQERILFNVNSDAITNLNDAVSTQSDLVEQRGGEYGSARQLVDLGVAVCITGQLSRLELASKVQNLLRPLAERYGPIHSFLALEHGLAIFSDKSFGRKLARPLCGAQMNMAQIETELEGFFPNATIGIQKHTKFNPDILQWPEFRRRRFRGPLQRRAENLEHAQAQHEHIARCAQMVVERETQLGGRYHTVVRIRDNTIVVKPFGVLPRLHESFPVEAVYVKGCAQTSWRGIHDKVAIIPRGLLYPATTAVVNALRRRTEGENIPNALRDSANAEVMLMHAWENAGVPWVTLPADEFPFVDGRCDSAVGGTGMYLTKYWCLGGICKDCEPADVNRTLYPRCNNEGLDSCLVTTSIGLVRAGDLEARANPENTKIDESADQDVGQDGMNSSTIVAASSSEAPTTVDMVVEQDDPSLDPPLDPSGSVSAPPSE